MADHRPNRYVENGVTVYRASALGSCVKTLVALGMGMTPAEFPDWLLKKFEEGIRGEPVVLDILKQHWRIADEVEGWMYDWEDGQILVEIGVGTHVIIRGHLDAIGTMFLNDEELLGKRVIEVKCVTGDYAKVILQSLPPIYQFQISAYAGYFKLPAFLALGIKDEDGVVQSVKTQIIDELPFTMAQVKARVARVEWLISRGELPKCDYKQFPCPFPWLCDEEWKEGTTQDWELEQKLEESLVMIKDRGNRE